MRFSQATSILLFCASAVSALSLPITERNVDVSQDDAFAKRDVAEATFDSVLDSREAVAEADAYPTTEYVELESRDAVSDAKKEIIKYLRGINTKNIGGPASWPKNWSDLHGDSKSNFDGKYVCQVMVKDNTYMARVIAHKKIGKTIPQGYNFGTTTVDKCKDKKGKELVPSYGRAVHFLRKHFGGDKPPKC